MKALVIGGNGFIGSHLVSRLLDEDWDVAVYDPHPERFRDAIKTVSYFIGDTRDTALLETALRGTDVVFHLASSTIPQSSNESPIFDIESNLIGTVNLLNTALKAQVRKIVFLSSGGTVYGVPRHLPIAECHPTSPISSYGIVKLAIEKYLHMFKCLYGLDYTVLRPSNPFGPRQNPLGSQGAIAVFLGRLARNRAVTIWGEGGTIRDYFFISDLIDACYTVALFDTKSDIYNIGSGEGKSLRELLRLLSAVTGQSFNVKYQPGRSFDIPELILDISKAREELAWQPTTSFEDGIARTWDWIQSLNLR